MNIDKYFDLKNFKEQIDPFLKNNTLKNRIKRINFNIDKNVLLVFCENILDKSFIQNNPNLLILIKKNIIDKDITKIKINVSSKKINKEEIKNINNAFNLEKTIKGDCNKRSYLFIEKLKNEVLSNEITNNIVSIIGEYGIGKSHLCKYFFNNISVNNNLDVIYEPTIEFMQNLIDQFLKKDKNERNTNLLRIKNKYKNADIIIFEDIHLTKNFGPGCYKELGEIIKSRQINNKLTIFTSSEPYSYLKNLKNSNIHDILLFESIQLKLKKLDKKTRNEMFLHYANKNNINSSDEETIDYITKLDFYDTPRKIIGLVNHININGSFCIDSINDYSQDTEIKRNSITLEELANLVSKYFDIDIKNLKSKSRTKDIVYCRNILFYLSSKHTRNSYLEIGAFFGKKHNSVIYSINKIEKEIKFKNTKINTDVANIEKSSPF